MLLNLARQFVFKISCREARLCVSQLLLCVQMKIQPGTPGALKVSIKIRLLGVFLPSPPVGPANEISMERTCQIRSLCHSRQPPTYFKEIEDQFQTMLRPFWQVPSATDQFLRAELDVC